MLKYLYVLPSGGFVSCSPPDGSAQINGQRAFATSPELLHISYELFVLVTHDIVIIILESN